ncbi:MAG: chromosome segregation protein SMC [Spirochaetae bacterium HGW-Spirochaetae-8]|nr:MAG: chromosome segregation protein SMC [Spirochaetae bacterium HGW-Spirochaetae-8]
MKILQLRFANLNSLYGEWAIDFTQRDYTADGIFAITGPTGAGKSTILDAICLALYARTPRLDSIGPSTNEIMSRQTGSCFAEVTFETVRGVYRCHWSQARARGQSTGKLQDSKHEIAQLPEGAILETKKRNVALLVEELTGMDYDRFTRSMLLAQGRFAAFLSAAADERSPILEQITGTKIYSDISIRVHERLSAEASSLEVLKAWLEGVDLLDPAEESQHKAQLEQELQAEQDLHTQMESTERLIAWLVSIDNLQHELVDLKTQRVKLELEIKDSSANRIRLQQALCAAELEGTYSTLCALRAQQAADGGALENGRSLLPELKATATQDEIALYQAKRVLACARDAQKSEAVLIKEVRSLDDQIASQQAQLDKDRKRIGEQEKSIAEILGKKKGFETRIAGLQQERQRNSEYISTHSQDGELCSSLTGLEQRITALGELQEQAQAARAELAAAMQAGGQLAGHVEEAREQESLATDRLRRLQSEITRLRTERADSLVEKSLREYRSERDMAVRERTLLARIATLEQDRQRLEDGKACPLCGALHHPYAEGNIPQPDAIEIRIAELDSLITKVEGLDDTLSAQGATEKELLVAKAEAEKTLSSLLSAAQNSQADYSRREHTVEACDEAIETKQKALLQEVGSYTATLPEGWCLQDLLEQLRSRKDAWQERMQSLDSCQHDEVLENAALIALNATLESRQSGLVTLQAEYEQADRACRSLIEQRSHLYGVRIPDIEEQRLELQVAQAEAKVQDAGNRLEKAKESLTNQMTRVQALEQSISERAVVLAVADAGFLQDAMGMGFDSEQDFLSARLDRVDRNSLQASLKAMDDQLTGLLEREQDRTRKLEEEAAKAHTNESKPSLQDRLAVLSSEYSLCSQKIGALKQRIDDNNQAKNRLIEHQKAFENQQKQYLRWKALDQLIGSYDGKKYRNFAQGLTFEIMIGHANHQLMLLTDRYLLVRDEQHPLELLVVDNYQAGEVRSTKNLSGGESFVVSLALALGLSTMASRKVRVDSLFLDEGFGTLDADALEAALDALSSLHSHGKLIGIISHVPALKERIGTQITVQPKSGGRSVLSGPGCVSR